MNASPTYLTAAEYRLILLSALESNDIDRSTAVKLVDSRWPVDVSGALSEAAGRGIQLDLSDVRAWLASGGAETLEPADVLFLESGVDSLLEWAIACHRGEPTIAAEIRSRAPGLLEALEAREAAPWN